NVKGAWILFHATHKGGKPINTTRVPMRHHVLQHQHMPRVLRPRLDMLVALTQDINPCKIQRKVFQRPLITKALPSLLMVVFKQRVKKVTLGFNGKLLKKSRVMFFNELTSNP